MFVGLGFCIVASGDVIPGVDWSVQLKMQKCQIFWCNMLRKWGQDAIFKFIFWKMCIFVIFTKIVKTIAKNYQIEAKNGFKRLTTV